MIGRWGPATCPTPPEGRVPEAGEVGCASGRPEMGVPADPDRLLPDPAARETYVPRARSLTAAPATYTPARFPALGTSPPRPQTHLPGCSEVPSKGVTEVPASNSRRGFRLRSLWTDVGG